APLDARAARRTPSSSRSIGWEPGCPPCRAVHDDPDPLAEPPRSPPVARERRVLVERDRQEREALDVLRESIDDGRALRLERPEQAIPYDEDAGVVSVEVFRIRAVVHAMMRRRVEH